MTKQELIERLMKTFLVELEEEVASLNRTLLALEKTQEAKDRKELLQTLFRSAHSLKGAARSVGITAIETTCHHLESLFAKAKESETVLPAEFFNICLKTADALLEAKVFLNEKRDLSESSLSKVQQSLAQVTLLNPPSSAPISSPSIAKIAEPLSEAGQTQTPIHNPNPISTISTPSTNAPLAIKVAPQKQSSESAPLVRVSSSKLDDLIAQTGELFISWQKMDRWQEMIDHIADSLFGIDTAFEIYSKEHIKHSDPEQLSQELEFRKSIHLLQHYLEKTALGIKKDRAGLFQALKGLDEDVREIRMLPFLEACLGLDRVVRDLSLELGKQVELKLEGADVEMDRSILDQIKSPLLHLIRNSIDHGLETPDERAAAGKPLVGQITVTTSIRSSQVEIVLEDDGRGLNREAIKEKARQRGLDIPKEDSELLDLVFLPGFSTAKIITELSGRGVGLDVLKTNIESLHGSVEIHSVFGKGTRFTLRVPLTLTTLRTVLTEVGGHIVAIPTSNIVRLLKLSAKDACTVEGTDALILDGKVLPIRILSDLLGFGKSTQNEDSKEKCAIVVSAGDKKVVWLVDRYINEQELVAKNLGRRVKRQRFISGATILANGEIGLILNVSELIRNSLTTKPISGIIRHQPINKKTTKKRILLVDDSLTTRSLEKSILESAGYEVIEAIDGEAAWKKLQESGFDLVVSDVEMPKMTGLELTDAIRKSQNWSSIPVILVTSLCKDADKRRGLEVGANAYIVKGEFDQSGLLETVAQLL